MRVTEKAAWIGFAGVVLAALIVILPRFFASDTELEDTPAEREMSTQEAVPPETTRTPSDSLTPDVTGEIRTLQQYAEKYASLDERFLERQEYEKSFIGKEVEWEGYVFSVFDVVVGKVGLHINAGPGLKGSLGISFDSSWRTKLYALRRDDKVRVRGIITEGGTGTFVRMEGIDLSRIEEP